MYRLGIDLGGTKIEGIALTKKKEEIFRFRLLTEQEGGYQHILHQIKKVYQTLLREITEKPHTLGMGTPGAISPRTGLLKNSNTVCFNGKLTKEELVKLLGKDFIIENDANCFALAEALQGAARGKDLVFGVIMGTGCGGGIIHQGRIHTGLQAIGGEWGHMVIDPNGPLCYCGTHGCVETFISGGGLQKQYRQKFGESLPLTEIVQRYREKDERAQSLMNEFFERFGRAMANLINILDPDIIVLGGGVSNIDELYTEGVEQVRKMVFSDSLETPIVKHQLGDSAGVIGAALIGI
ncbi:MAG: ROK family protein [Candidatus Omnitrophica bacterium]|nr:ROK family protein [Candidatus Omnitrophota bacterium]